FGQYGEMRISHVPNGGGTNVFPLRNANALHTLTGATLKKTDGKAELVTTQEHGVIPEGRDIIREVDANIKAKVDGNAPPKTAPHQDSHSEHGPKVGIPPNGHITDDMLKKEFQGGYGNKQQQPAPVRDKQERFPLDLARPELLDSQFQ